MDGKGEEIIYVPSRLDKSIRISGVFPCENRGGVGPDGRGVLCTFVKSSPANDMLAQIPRLCENKRSDR